jgi:adenylate kinase
MNVVLMGPPGVGKGTQAAALKALLGVPHVSTGDILRASMNEGSPLGKKVKEYVDSGRLVPDDLVGDLIAERLGRHDAARGFVLDGFPRTMEHRRPRSSGVSAGGGRVRSAARFFTWRAGRRRPREFATTADRRSCNAWTTPRRSFGSV